MHGNVKQISYCQTEKQYIKNKKLMCPTPPPAAAALQAVRKTAAMNACEKLAQEGPGWGLSLSLLEIKGYGRVPPTTSKSLPKRGGFYLRGKPSTRSELGASERWGYLTDCKILHSDPRWPFAKMCIILHKYAPFMHFSRKMLTCMFLVFK